MTCQDFFCAKSYIFPRRYLARTSSKGTRPFSLFGSRYPRLLYPYCITTWAVCQGVSYIFSEFFFESTYARATLAMASIRLRLPSPLDTNSIPHPPPDCNRQNAQNRDFYFLDICATFLLTNCWRYAIMEICAPHTRGRAAKILCIMYKKPTAFVSRSQKRWGNSIQKLAISGATPIAFS